jgi:hypothetical protein
MREGRILLLDGNDFQDGRAMTIEVRKAIEAADVVIFEDKTLKEGSKLLKNKYGGVGVLVVMRDKG